MKERPILFSAPMVRALLAGTKTQTRRIVKPTPDWTEPGTAWQHGHGHGHSGTGWYAHREEYPEEGALYYRCPYGHPGDRLWVREAWRTVAEADALPPRELNEAHRLWHEADTPHQPGFGKLRPSMFMPRWASRILLEVTGVRVERLQDISEADAIAEGIERREDACGDWMHYGDTGLSVDAVGSYRSLWERINGEASWKASPWVWVVEFRRASP